MEEIDLAIVESPLGGIAPEAAAAKADKTIDTIIQQATQVMPKAIPQKIQKPYPAATVSVADDVEDVNNLFYKNSWCDGLPIIPPTVERVEKMLSGTSLKPDQLIGLIPPRMGAATVQVIAINAVMAGAKPEHLPVIIAAVKASLHPKVELRSWLTTTRPANISMFVQGPILKELGIAYGQSALLPGPKPNAAIGRAFMLTVRLLGGIIAPPDKVGTMTTLGTPSYSICMGENEDALPKGWNPLRVDCGLKLEDSVVSVFGGVLPVIQNDHDSTNGRDVLMSTCYRIGGMLSRACSAVNYPGMIILFGPEHAATIASAGYSKEDVKGFLFENATAPREWLVKGGVWFIEIATQPDWIKKQVDDLKPWIQMFDNPEEITISVTGGAGKQSIVGIGYANAPPVLIQGATLTRAGR